MKAYVEIYEKVELTLSGDEARWLKYYMQNTLISTESLQDVRMRKEIFIALKEAGIE